MAALACAVLGLTTGCPAKRSTEKTLTSPDEQFQIAVPPAWDTEDDLNDVAEIQAAYRSSDMYVVVIRDEKADLFEVDLKKFAELGRDSLLEDKKEVQVSDAAPLTIDGHSALQFEIRAVHEHTRVIYLQTVLETPQHFYQILTWTVPSRWEQNRKTLQEIPKRFKETLEKANPGSVPAAEDWISPFA
jgi:hypothetical protein